jgi:hypothetical protein
MASALQMRAVLSSEAALTPRSHLTWNAADLTQSCSCSGLPIGSVRRSQIQAFVRR